MKFKEEELLMLSSRKGITKLLMKDQLDFKGTLDLLKFEESLTERQVNLIKLQNKISEKKRL